MFLQVSADFKYFNILVVSGIECHLLLNINAAIYLLL